MSASSKTRSFSAWRRWRIGFQVGVLLLLVLLVLAMVNYLSQDHYLRWAVGERRALGLTDRTTYFVRSLTNEVKVVIYFDREDDQGLYAIVADLLNEYKAVTSKISVRTVDYLRDATAAQKVKADYKLTQPTDKNLVIFDCDGRHKAVPADALVQVELERLADDPGSKKPLFRRKPVASYAEAMFDAALLDVTSRRPYKAYFLTGHGEHGIDSGDPLTGYLTLAAIFQQNYLQVQPLLLGTNGVPKDCDLLVVGGPNSPLLDQELDSIERYLNQGGQMLALFNSLTERETGLENLLTNNWGVRFSSHPVVDPEHTDPRDGGLVVSAFSKHPLVNSLFGYGLYLVRPRAVGAPNDARSQGAEAPRVDEIAFSGTNACLAGISGHQPQRFPLAVAIEKGVIKGVSTERGTTRIVVVGDSFFLANAAIDQMANRDFAFCAINWLLDRPRLLGGVGPRPLREYRLIMSRGQLQRTEWILLGGMPGIALLIGAGVWMRRRN